MAHLYKHVAKYIRYWGPVKSFWMYAFEDLFGWNKRFIKSRSHPVASIMVTNQNTIIADIALEFLALSKRVAAGVPRGVGFQPVVELEARVDGVGTPVFIDQAMATSIQLWMSTQQVFVDMKAAWSAKHESTRQAVHRENVR
jgi:hypothetical protein